MNTNPIKKLSSLFGKLIIEHGSAVVQEKHIALLKEQFALLEKENTGLQAENTGLQAENNALKNEIINLKKKIHLYEKSSHVVTIDETELQILTYFASQDHDEISPEDIAESLGINLQITAFHLDNLKIKQMVTSRQIAPFDMSPKRFWSLSHCGRSYLIENKHIS